MSSIATQWARYLSDPQLHAAAAADPELHPHLARNPTADLGLRVRLFSGLDANSQHGVLDHPRLDLASTLAYLKAKPTARNAAAAISRHGAHGALLDLLTPAKLRTKTLMHAILGAHAIDVDWLEVNDSPKMPAYLSLLRVLYAPAVTEQDVIDVLTRCGDELVHESNYIARIQAALARHPNAVHHLVSTSSRHVSQALAASPQVALLDDEEQRALLHLDQDLPTRGDIWHAKHTPVWTIAAANPAIRLTVLHDLCQQMKGNTRAGRLTTAAIRKRLDYADYEILDPATESDPNRLAYLTQWAISGGRCAAGWLVTFAANPHLTPADWKVIARGYEADFWLSGKGLPTPPPFAEAYRDLRARFTDDDPAGTDEVLDPIVAAVRAQLADSQPISEEHRASVLDGPVRAGWIPHPKLPERWDDIIPAGMTQEAWSLTLTLMPTFEGTYRDLFASCRAATA